MWDCHSACVWCVVTPADHVIYAASLIASLWLATTTWCWAVCLGKLNLFQLFAAAGCFIFFLLHHWSQKGLPSFHLCHTNSFGLNQAFKPYLILSFNLYPICTYMFHKIMLYLSCCSVLWFKAISYNFLVFVKSFEYLHWQNMNILHE